MVAKPTAHKERLDISAKDFAREANKAYKVEKKEQKKNPEDPERTPGDKLARGVKKKSTDDTMKALGKRAGFWDKQVERWNKGDGKEKAKMVGQGILIAGVAYIGIKLLTKAVKGTFKAITDLSGFISEKVEAMKNASVKGVLKSVLTPVLGAAGIATLYKMLDKKGMSPSDLLEIYKKDGMKGIGKFILDGASDMGEDAYEGLREALKKVGVTFLPAWGGVEALKKGKKKVGDALKGAKDRKEKAKKVSENLEDGEYITIGEIEQNVKKGAQKYFRKTIDTIKTNKHTSAVVGYLTGAYHLVPVVLKSPFVLLEHCPDTTGGKMLAGTTLFAIIKYMQTDQFKEARIAKTPEALSAHLAVQFPKVPKEKINLVAQELLKETPDFKKIVGPVDGALDIAIEVAHENDQEAYYNANQKGLTYFRGHLLDRKDEIDDSGEKSPKLDALIKEVETLQKRLENSKKQGDVDTAWFLFTQQEIDRLISLADEVDIMISQQDNGFLAWSKKENPPHWFGLGVHQIMNKNKVLSFRPETDALWNAGNLDTALQALKHEGTLTVKKAKEMIGKNGWIGFTVKGMCYVAKATAEGGLKRYLVGPVKATEAVFDAGWDDNEYEGAEFAVFYGSSLIPVTVFGLAKGLRESISSRKQIGKIFGKALGNAVIFPVTPAKPLWRFMKAGISSIRHGNLDSIKYQAFLEKWNIQAAFADLRAKGTLGLLRNTPEGRAFIGFSDVLEAKNVLQKCHTSTFKTGQYDPFNKFISRRLGLEELKITNEEGYSKVMKQLEAITQERYTVLNNRLQMKKIRSIPVFSPMKATPMWAMQESVSQQWERYLKKTSDLKLKAIEAFDTKGITTGDGRRAFLEELESTHFLSDAEKQDLKNLMKQGNRKEILKRIRGFENVESFEKLIQRLEHTRFANHDDGMKAFLKELDDMKEIDDTTKAQIKERVMKNPKVRHSWARVVALLGPGMAVYSAYDIHMAKDKSKAIARHLTMWGAGIAGAKAGGTVFSKGTKNPIWVSVGALGGAFAGVFGINTTEIDKSIENLLKDMVGAGKVSHAVLNQGADVLRDIELITAYTALKRNPLTRKIGDKIIAKTVWKSAIVRNGTLGIVTRTAAGKEALKLLGKRITKKVSEKSIGMLIKKLAKTAGVKGGLKLVGSAASSFVTGPVGVAMALWTAVDIAQAGMMLKKAWEVNDAMESQGGKDLVSIEVDGNGKRVFKDYYEQENKNMKKWNDLSTDEQQAFMQEHYSEVEERLENRSIVTLHRTDGSWEQYHYEAGAVKYLKINTGSETLELTEEELGKVDWEKVSFTKQDIPKETYQKLIQEKDPRAAEVFYAMAILSYKEATNFSQLEKKIENPRTIHIQRYDMDDGSITMKLNDNYEWDIYDGDTKLAKGLDFYQAMGLANLTLYSFAKVKEYAAKDDCWKSEDGTLSPFYKDGDTIVYATDGFFSLDKDFLQKQVSLYRNDLGMSLETLTKSMNGFFKNHAKKAGLIGN